MVSLEQLGSVSAPDHLRRLRSIGPVSWVEAIGGWMVTGRDAAVAVLRDADTFTVDDERFSTAVVVGTSMLSTDGDDHARHRAPFSGPFVGTAVAQNFGQMVVDAAHRLVREITDRGQAELRTEVAGPLAVSVIVRTLGLGEVDEAHVLGWYRSIVDGVDRVSAGLEIEEATRDGLASLREAIESSQAASPLLSAARSKLTADELFANTAVLMFGAIETNEGMTANALWHLLTVPQLIDTVQADRRALADLVEESLRLEPAATVVDRYATRDVEIAGARINAGDFVRVSLAGANRDPHAFVEPDRFDINRINSRHHLAFVQGPHVCLGLHLARAQTIAALNVALDLLPELKLAPDAGSAPTGLIFRKPDQLVATWTRTSDVSRPGV